MNRQRTPPDRLIGALDNALRTLFAPQTGGTRPNPAADEPTPELDATTTRHVAGLMRVNQAGEVAAQGLYQGHALVARDAALDATLQHAAAEERDHLNWCSERLVELDARPSLLNPLWYGGAFVMGALSGLAGDRYSLGFIAETEKQVVEHLDDHLKKLPTADTRSRAILKTMQDEEADHGDNAAASGGEVLPAVVRQTMRQVSKLMTRGAYWV
ncbi:MAG: 2-polyprenyl-3-methyl-6-methoxy-1,4-benzoquinone monooxygenase [Pseudomonadota bacterium]